MSSFGVEWRFSQNLASRRWWWAAGIALVRMVLSVSPAPAAEPPLRVGFVGGIGGASYAVARDEIDGFRLAVKELGGKLGDAEPILTANDERFDADSAINAAFDAESGGSGLHVMLLSSGDAVGADFAAQAEARQRFVINLGSTDVAVSGIACSPFFFSLAPAAQTISMIAGRYFQALGLARIALVEQSATPAVGDQGSLDTLRGVYAGEIDQILVKPGEMGFNGAIREIRERRPEAVFLGLEGGMAVNFLWRLRQAGAIGNARVYGSATKLDQPTLAAAGDAAGGVYTIGPWSDDLDSPGNHKLVTDFAAEYGRPASYAAAQGYDAALLIDAALHEAGGVSADPDAIRDGLRHASFAGTRPGFRFDNDQFPVQTYFLRQAEEDARANAVEPTRTVLARDLRPAQTGTCPLQWGALPETAQAKSKSPGKSR